MADRAQTRDSADAKYGPAATGPPLARADGSAARQEEATLAARWNHRLHPRGLIAASGRPRLVGQPASRPAGQPEDARARLAPPARVGRNFITAPLILRAHYRYYKRACQPQARPASGPKLTPTRGEHRAPEPNTTNYSPGRQRQDIVCSPACVCVFRSPRAELGLDWRPEGREEAGGGGSAQFNWTPKRSQSG